jgi:cytochrome c oxidase subunit 1
MVYGQKAGANPWGAKGLEWQTTSPPPTYNFDYPVVVDEEAYEYDREARRVAQQEVQSA